MFYFDIILLLVFAVFIFVRLYSVLGTHPEQKTEVKVVSREEFEKAYETIRREVEKKMDAQPPAAACEEGSEMDKVLYSIPNFDREDFCKRCAKVFEMVLEAFAARDEETLKMLTGKKLFEKFRDIIRQRTADGITAETDLIKVNELCIKDARISAKGIASIAVRFISEQINLLKNSAGEVIEGDENFVQKITDIWTFEKDINSPSPVWQLVSTKKS